MFVYYYYYYYCVSFIYLFIRTHFLLVFMGRDNGTWPPAEFSDRRLHSILLAGAYVHRRMDHSN